MRLYKLLLCGAVALALAFPAVLAEEAPVKEAAVPTETPAPLPSPESASLPSEPPAETASPESSASPEESTSPQPDTSPSLSPEATVSPEATFTPEETASPEPTISPEETTTPEPGTTPDAPSIPKPGEISDEVAITPEGGVQLEDESWQIPEPKAKLRFDWKVDAAAVNYLLYIQDAEENLRYLGETVQPAAELPATDYASGAFTFFVGAVLEDGSLLWGSAVFEITGNIPEAPGGRPGGGFRPGSAGAGMPAEEQGFRVTPGEALTSDHAKGSKDMTRYTDAGIVSGEAPVTALVLGVTQAEITLDDGNSAFTVQAEDTSLILNPAEQGSEWKMSVLALRALSESGYDRISLTAGTAALSLSTQMEFSGQLYAGLRAEGYVDKDFMLHITEHGIAVSIAGTNYSINESGELAPLEG